MATDFITNQIAVSNTMMNLATNMPLDARTVINHLDDVKSIPNPFIGMIFYVNDINDKNKLYFVKSLKEKVDSIVGITIPNGLIDEYEPLVDPSIYLVNIDDFYSIEVENEMINSLEQNLLNLESEIAGNTNILTNMIHEDFSNLNNVIINEGYYDQENKHVSF